MGLFTRQLGIDLGTANTLVFVPRKGVVLNEPSVVAVSMTDKKIMAVGNEAKLMVGKTPDTIIAYRPMKDGVIADYRITQVMLRYYIKKALGSWSIAKPEILISVPAGITSTEQRSVIEASSKAGAKRTYVIKEPILAAIGARIPIYEPTGHMIVDIGGGTTDVAVISLGGIVASTSVKVAGNKIDQAIADYIKKHYNLAIGDKTAEDIKITIGSAIPIDEDQTYEIRGRDMLSGLPRVAHITTNEIVKAVEADLREITKAIKIVLQKTPPELSADIIDRGIVMTGGSSLLRHMPELVYRATGVRAYIAEEALFCVANGTGIALEHLETYKKSIATK